MDFAKRQLLKYGWSEGRGLGRNEDGIAKALKPKLKFDNCGVGHDAGAEFTNNWWERAFNDAAQNIDVKVTDKEVKLQTKREDENVDISTKSFSVRRYKESPLEYGTFIKTAKLSDGGTEDYAKRIVIHKPKNYSFCTDEELFAACKGRTGHKGARHGVKLGGKLSRLEKQEKLLLKKMKKISLSDNNMSSNTKKIEKKFKKINEHKDDWSDGKYTSLSESEITTPSSSQLSLKKKNKKKKKSVSFNETVTKIYTADLDTSFDSEVSSLKDENSNDASTNNINNNSNNNSGSDEGIEQDLENNNNLNNNNNNNNGRNQNNDVEIDNHKSFEEARLTFEELSKAERKKLMKKRKYDLLGNKFHTPKKHHQSEEKDATTTKKRKFIPEESDELVGSVTESPDRFKRKRDKKIRQKHYRSEEKVINSITKSLEGHCRISESD